MDTTIDKFVALTSCKTWCKRVNLVGSSYICSILIDVVCVSVFSSHLFWTPSSLDVPARITQEEGHTGFLIHLPSPVHALIFSRRPWSRILCTNDLIVLHLLGIFYFLFFCEEKIKNKKLPGFELTYQNERRLLGWQLIYCKGRTRRQLLIFKNKIKNLQFTSSPAVRKYYRTTSNCHVEGLIVRLFLPQL